MRAEPHSVAAGSRTRIWIGAGVALVVVAALAVLAVVKSGGGSDPGGQQRAVAGAPSAAGQQQKGQQPPDDLLASLARREPGDPLAKGRVDAPVVMVEWEEFQCPFCGRYSRKTEPELIKKYVKAGKVRIEWHDYPYLGPESTTAAHAGRAAAAQDKFWKYHDYLFAHQKSVNSGKLTKDYLVSLAGKLGMNTTEFRTDMASTKVAKAVERDKQEAISLGITGTPAFLIGDKPTIGAQPTTEFEQIIEAQLAAAK
jgi:protein-disulfide isomerase